MSGCHTTTRVDDDEKRLIREQGEGAYIAMMILKERTAVAPLRQSRRRRRNAKSWLLVHSGSGPDAAVPLKQCSPAPGDCDVVVRHLNGFKKR